MDISINEQPADIVLESEKTVGDLLSGIEEWLQGSANRISGLRIDGHTINAVSLPEVCEQDLQNITSIDITVSSWQDLALEALVNIREDLKIYETGSFEEQRHIKDSWEASVTAHFLAEQIPDIFVLAHKTILGEGLAPGDMTRIIDERIRELIDPFAELKNISALISDVAVRLEDIPLDIQTGKDSKVAETVQFFSHIVDKLFRLVRFLRLQGYVVDTISVDTLPFNSFIDAFSAILKELLTAYEAQDAVLVGDLAEYELAPRLLKLYSAINDKGWMT
ncbi:MAG: hypothetical protein LBD29_07165 [Treponema sp.]|jgi:hypothetical protein|nr:hypothetical protein [Treponema sp.]